MLLLMKSINAEEKQHFTVSCFMRFQLYRNAFIYRPSPSNIALFGCSLFLGSPVPAIYHE